MIIGWIIGFAVVAVVLYLLFGTNPAPKHTKGSPRAKQPSHTPGIVRYGVRGKTLSQDEVKTRIASAEAEVAKGDAKNAAIEKNMKAKVQKELDALGIEYLPSFSPGELYELKEIAVYVDFVRDSIKAVLDPKKRNEIIWKVRSDKGLSNTIRDYETNRAGTAGYRKVEYIMKQVVGS